MRIIYVITLEEGIKSLRYFEVSFLTLRHTGCELPVVIATDRVNADHPALREVAGKYEVEVSICDLGEFNDASAMVKSRVIKSGLRGFLTGDLLSMDCDMIVTQDPSQLDTQYSLAVAADSYKIGSLGAFPEWLRPHYEEMGWSCEMNNYFNTGLIIWKDTDKAHAIGRMWSDHWRELYTKEGIAQDQGSFNVTLTHYENEVEALPQKWNALVTFDRRFALDAGIYHFLESRKRNRPHLLDQLVIDLKETGELNVERLEQGIQNNDPWCGSPINFREAMVLKQYLKALKFRLQDFPLLVKWRLQALLQK